MYFYGLWDFELSKYTKFYSNTLQFIKIHKKDELHNNEQIKQRDRVCDKPFLYIQI